MASTGGGVQATNEIPEVEMDIVEWPQEEPELVGSKRARDSPNGKGSYGFCGVTTAGNVDYARMNYDGTSKIRGRYLHGTHGSETLPDSNALRLRSSSPGENLENKTKRPTKICTFYAQGRCQKGKSCTFLHEREGPGSDNRWNNVEKAVLLAAAGNGYPRGSEEGSQVHRLSSLKVPQLKDSEGSSKDELYRNLIHVYGEDSRRLARPVDKRNSPTPGVSQGMSCSIDDSLTKNELVQSPVVHEKNHEPFMGHHSSLASETYFDGRDTFPRLLDGGNLQSDMDKENSLNDLHVSRIHLDVNPLNSDHRYRSYSLSIPSDPLQYRENLSAYGGITDILPDAHQKEHRPNHASYSSHSVTGFRNPVYATSDHCFSSPTLRTTSYQGILPHHLFTPGIEKVGLHKYVDVDKGCGTSKPAFLARSSPQPSILSAGSLSPIKDEVWETSVPFVPSFTFPDNTTPSRSQYDPFVDIVEPPKVENTNNFKSSNISCSISGQHTNQYVVDKSLNCDDKLTRNIPAKGSNELACLTARDRGRSSSLDDNNRVKACDRKNDAANNNENTREFRFHLTEHVKELIKPIWKEGNLSKDAHKLVVKKSVDKVLASIEPHLVPTTEELITNYITASGSKIEKLVKAYVDRHRTT
uniref:C3H1-type domain-containing protein n=1 Tax=Arundo donax TaxID=35708 RepID=A0A0A9DUH9_ARUDO